MIFTLSSYFLSHSEFYDYKLTSVVFQRDKYHPRTRTRTSINDLQCLWVRLFKFTCFGLGHSEYCVGCRWLNSGTGCPDIWFKCSSLEVLKTCLGKALRNCSSWPCLCREAELYNFQRSKKTKTILWSPKLSTI